MAKTRIGTWNGVPVFLDLLPFGTRRTGRKLDSGTPKFAVFHDTGNPDTTAQGNVNYYKNTYNIDWSATASAHIFVDDVECIVCVPLDEKAWHVLYNTPTDNAWYGADANDVAFGIEVCYFSNQARSRKSLDNAARVMAALCNDYKINPTTHMPGHQDIQSDKIDPGNLLAACGYARNRMDIVDKLIVNYMKGNVPSVPAPVKKDDKAVKPAAVSVPNTYKIKAGDTLFGVATKYDLKVSDVIAWNKGLNPKALKVGQVVSLKAPKVTFNKAAKRGRSTGAYASGTIDSYGADVRARKGNRLTGFNFNTRVGRTLKPGETVYIFETLNGWGKIYTGSNVGADGNLWVYLDRVNITKVYK